MRAKATKAKAAQGMDRRAAADGRAGRDAPPTRSRGSASRNPRRAATPRSPRHGPLKAYGSLEVFTGVDLAVDRGAGWSCSALNGAGKTTLLRCSPGGDRRHRRGRPRPRAAGWLLRAGARDARHERTIHENLQRPAPMGRPARVRSMAGAFMFSGDDIDKPAKVLSGGARGGARVALARLLPLTPGNLLLMDEPTNHLDPVSRQQVLNALRTYTGAIVLVTHDEGAVEALQPEKVILLPDGVEDAWNEDLSDLIALA